jgi:TatD DNase family protein
VIDTHCHLDSERFHADRSEVLRRAWAAGLEAIVIPGIGPDNWETLVAMGQADSRLWIALGIHPQFLPELPPDGDSARMEQLDALLRGSKGAGAVPPPQVVAVGECGLDGPSAEGAPMERQLAVLRGHLAVAREHDLPAILHCYHAHPAMLALLESTPLPEAGVVLHSYSGGPELVRPYARLGCYFSFAGPVTYPKARKPLLALKAVPPDQLLLETDAPDQSPHPHRGERCEPAYLVHTLEAAAEALGMPVTRLAEQTSRNARRLFRRDGRSL